MAGSSPKRYERPRWALLVVIILKYILGYFKPSTIVSVPGSHSSGRLSTSLRNVTISLASEVYRLSDRHLSAKFSAERGVSRGQRSGSRTAVNLSFLDRSRYFFFK
jgi:hypothetical protein